MLILSVFLLFISFLGYYRFRNYFAPIVISPASWGIVLFLYSTLDHGMFEVSSKCIIVILLWNLSLLIGAYLFTTVDVKHQKRTYKPKKHFNKWVRNLYFNISLWGLFPALLISYKQATSMDAGDFMFNLRMANTGIVESEYDQGIFAYVYTFAFVSYLIELLSYQRGDDRKRLFIICFVNIVLSFVTMAKSSVLFLLFSSLVIIMYKTRVSIKKIILGGVVALLLMSSIQLLRAGDNSNRGEVISGMLYGYILGGLPALSQLVESDMHSKYSGQYSLAFFDNVKVKFGMALKRSKECLHDITDAGYIYVPVPTNVYTMIGPFWLDYKFGGVLIFGFIIGSLSGFFFRQAMKGEMWAVVLYAYFSCILMLQFFGEYVFTNLSYLIQLVVLSLFASNFTYILKWRKSTFSLPRLMEKNT